MAETVHAMTETSKAFRLLVKRVRDRATPIGALMVFYRYWVVATNFGSEWSVSRVLEWHQMRESSKIRLCAKQGCIQPFFRAPFLPMLFSGKVPLESPS